MCALGVLGGGLWAVIPGVLRARGWVSETISTLLLNYVAILLVQFVGVPFFIVAFGNEVDRPYLTELAARTNGRLFEAPGPADLEALYASIGRLLRSQYAVTFDASAAPIDVDSTITVTVNAGDRSASDDATFRASANFLPQFLLTGVDAGESLKAAREITAEIEGGATPRLTWYVDDVNVLEQVAPPYVYTYEPAQFPEGEHLLRVTAGVGNTPIEQTLAFSSECSSKPVSIRCFPKARTTSCAT
jgi:hypothetical protein